MTVCNIFLSLFLFVSPSIYILVWPVKIWATDVSRQLVLWYSCTQIMSKPHWSITGTYGTKVSPCILRMAADKSVYIKVRKWTNANYTYLTLVSLYMCKANYVDAKVYPQSGIPILIVFSVTVEREFIAWQHCNIVETNDTGMRSKQRMYISVTKVLNWACYILIDAILQLVFLF